jgi:hypothetical protein
MPSLIRQQIYILVRREQVDEYRKRNPEVNILPIMWDIPQGAAMATTRQYILETAKVNGWPHVVQMDDDIMNLTAIFRDVTGKGEPVSRKLSKEDVTPDVQGQIYLLMCRAARTMFAEVPNTMSAWPDKMMFNFGAALSDQMYVVDKVAHTWGMGVFNMEVIAQNGLFYDPYYNILSEDIAIMLMGFDRGCNIGVLPTIQKNQDWSRESTIRTPDKRKELNNMEPFILQKYDSAKFMRVSQTYEDGTSESLRVDWKKFHKARGTKPIVRNWND